MAVGVAGVGAAVGAGGSIFSSIMGASGAKRSADAIRYSADQGTKLALELNAQSRADLKPFRDMGVQSGAQLSDVLSGKTNISDSYKASSLYDFQSDLGTRALNRQLSAKGMSGSGAGLESLALFDKSLVAEEGERYFDKLFKTTQIGANAAAQSGSLTTQTGNTVGQIQSNAGVGIGQAYQNQYNAIGSAGQGVAGAIRGGIGDYLSMQYLDRFFPSGGSPGGGTGSPGVGYSDLNIRGSGGQPGYAVNDDFGTFS